MNVRYALPICVGYWSPNHRYITFPSTFRKWHFQAMGRVKIGFQNHMSSKPQSCQGKCVPYFYDTKNA